MKNSKESLHIEQAAFIFDLRSILADSPSAFSKPKVKASMLNRINYLSKLNFGAIAIISDREVSKLKEILHSTADSLFLVGSYGGETLSRTGEYRCALPSAKIEAVRAELRAFVEQLKPAYIEEKILSLAVHFGAAPEYSGKIYKKLSEIGESLGNQFQVVEGHFCWELKESVHNKGSAVRKLLEQPEFAGRTPYFFGSELSSESAFLSTKLHNGHAVYVGNKTQQRLANSRADHYITDSNAVDDWLRTLCVTQSISGFSNETDQVKAKAA